MEELFEAFCRYLKKKKISSNTLQSYRHDIYQFMVFVRSCGVENFSDIDQKLLEKYLKYLHAKGFSDATLARNLSCIRSFYKYLIASHKATLDPTVGLKIDKMEQKLPDIMDGDEVERLLAQPDALSVKGKRDKAMLEVLYATGMRVSELLGLSLRDVNLDIGYTVTAVNTKKERMIPLYPLAIKSLKDYLDFAYPVLKKEKVSGDALFLNVHGQPMSRQGFWKIIKTYAKSADIQKSITPITLRHSFVTHLLRNGADINTVKDMLGHSALSSTKVYAKIIKNQYMSVYEHCHPRAKVRG